MIDANEQTVLVLEAIGQASSPGGPLSGKSPIPGIPAVKLRQVLTDAVHSWLPRTGRSAGRPNLHSKSASRVPVPWSTARLRFYVDLRNVFRDQVADIQHKFHVFRLESSGQLSDHCLVDASILEGDIFSRAWIENQFAIPGAGLLSPRWSPNTANFQDPFAPFSDPCGMADHAEHAMLRVVMPTSISRFSCVIFIISLCFCYLLFLGRNAFAVPQSNRDRAPFKSRQCVPLWSNSCRWGVKGPRAAAPGSRDMRADCSWFGVQSCHSPGYLRSKTPCNKNYWLTRSTK